MDKRNFFRVHRDLPREGPGLPEDVLWALNVTMTSGAVNVLDAACGPGADLLTLAEALPDAQIRGIDQVEHFVAQANANVAKFHPRVSAEVGDMTDLTGPYDLIWCAGALYFLGVTEGLKLWEKALAPGGHIVFSEPVLVKTPSSSKVEAFWEEYPQITDFAGIAARVADAHYKILDHRLIIGAPWEAYYMPMKARLAELRADTPDDGLQAMIELNAREIELWTAAQDEVAYTLMVVQPEQPAPKV